MAEYVRVKSPFVIYPEGRRRILRAGDVVTTDDDAYRGREVNFEPLAAHVEQATQAPGERRAAVPPQPEPEPDAEDGFVCDVCGDEFATGRGLKIHHGQKHGEDA